MGLKSVVFLCRMYLSMYFSPKKVFCLIAEFFCFDTWIQHAFCPSRGNKNPYGSYTTTLCISIGKELFIRTYKCSWYKPSHFSSLIGCYNAIYVTLDKIQTTEHWFIPASLIIMCMVVSFLLFIFSVLMFWVEKSCFMTVLHNFCLIKRNGLHLKLGKSSL